MVNKKECHRNDTLLNRNLYTYLRYEFILTDRFQGKDKQKTLGFSACQNGYALNSLHHFVIHAQSQTLI